MFVDVAGHADVKMWLGFCFRSGLRVFLAAAYLQLSCFCIAMVFDGYV